MSRRTRLKLLLLLTFLPMALLGLHLAGRISKVVGGPAQTHPAPEDLLGTWQVKLKYTEYDPLLGSVTKEKAALTWEVTFASSDHVEIAGEDTEGNPFGMSGLYSNGVLTFGAAANIIDVGPQHFPLNLVAGTAIVKGEPGKLKLKSGVFTLSTILVKTRQGKLTARQLAP